MAKKNPEKKDEGKILLNKNFNTNLIVSGASYYNNLDNFFV